MFETLLLMAIFAYANCMFLRIIFSFLESIAQFSPPDPLRPALNFLFDLTEPFLRLFRGLLPAIRLGGMGLDLSPIIAFLVLRVAATVVARTL